MAPRKCADPERFKRFNSKSIAQGVTLVPLGSRHSAARGSTLSGSGTSRAESGALPPAINFHAFSVSAQTTTRRPAFQFAHDRTALVPSFLSRLFDEHDPWRMGITADDSFLAVRLARIGACFPSISEQRHTAGAKSFNLPNTP